MNINRREFLSTTLAGAATAVAAPSLLAADAAAENNPFKVVPLGKTGLKVTLVASGTGMRGGNRQSNMTRMGKEKFEALLKYQFEQGIRFFDLADMYGTHEYLAGAFAAIPREQYVINTKIWFMGGALPEKERPDANICIDRFRKELKTDYIDLVLIHCMTDANWTEKMAKQMDIMADQKAKGLIKAHGVSCHSLAALKAAAEHPWVDSIHTRINAFGDAMDDKNPAVVAEVIKKAHANGKGIVGMKLIGEGRYRNDPAKKDESIKYVLGLNAVDTMIVGFESTAEVDDFSARVKRALSGGAA